MEEKLCTILSSNSARAAIARHATQTTLFPLRSIPVLSIWLGERLERRLLKWAILARTVGSGTAPPLTNKSISTNGQDFSCPVFCFVLFISHVTKKFNF